MPRYIAVDRDGRETEFLYDKLGDASLGLVFLKGYQWPFDTRKVPGSSQIDLLVAEQIKLGNRVYLDFTQNPKGLEKGFDCLPNEAYDYLDKSGALFGTPIKRLAKMNQGAIDLYAAHGIDLTCEYLEIAVCAQHCNGGVAVDGNWQSSIPGLYAAGEAAGTFGVYRPGGSALNSTQVGSLRAAEHIAKQPARKTSSPAFTLPQIRYGESNLSAIREEYQLQMSNAADFDRSSRKMQALFEQVCKLCDDFFSIATIGDKTQMAELWKLYDMVLTQRSVLSAMLHSARTVGSHGSAYVDRLPCESADENSRTLTRGAVSESAAVSPMPNPELWFEKVLAKNRKEER